MPRLRQTMENFGSSLADFSQSSDGLRVTAAVVKQIAQIIRRPGIARIRAHRRFKNGDFFQPRRKAIIRRERGGAAENVSARPFRRPVFPAASRACNAPAAARPSFGRANRRCFVPAAFSSNVMRLAQKTRRGRNRGPVQRASANRSPVPRRTNAAPTSRADPAPAFRAAAPRLPRCDSSLRRTMALRFRARRLSVFNRSERLRCSSAAAQSDFLQSNSASA